MLIQKKRINLMKSEIMDQDLRSQYLFKLFSSLCFKNPSFIISSGLNDFYFVDETVKINFFCVNYHEKRRCPLY